MKTVLAAILAVLVAQPLWAQSKPNDPARAIVAMGAYVATEDIAGSAAFYEALLDREPAIALPDFVAFDVSGGWFALASKDRYAPHAQPGSGAVPYLQATDLVTIQTRVRKMLGDSSAMILQEPGIHILKVTDPNGQLVEFFQLVP